VVLHDAAPLREPSWYSPAYVRVQDALLPRIARRARWVITVSAFSAAELRELLGVEAAVVPGGVDHARFHPGVAVPERPPYVLTVASLTARKNTAALAEAARRLRRAGHRAAGRSAASGPQFAAEAPVPGRRAARHGPRRGPPRALRRARAPSCCRRSTRASGCPCSRRWPAGRPSWPRTRPRSRDVRRRGAPGRSRATQRAIADALDAALAAPEPLRAARLERAAEFSWDRTARELDALLHPRDGARPGLA
jgi:glycosyltransferase involved in cell wall biosynthesis